MLRNAMMVAVFLLGCSSKSGSGGGTSTQKCDAYAERYAMLIDPDPARKDVAFRGARQACENGRITEEQIRCIDDASSQNGARACMGLSPVPGPRKTPALSKTEIAGVEGKGITTDALTERQKQWLNQLANMLELCERIPAPAGAPQTFDVVATYGSGFRGDVDGTAIPEPFRECISARIASAKPDSSTRIYYNVPITFHVTVRVP